MSRFVLTAQLQLQAPNNVAQVVRQIQSQLNGLNVNLNVQGSARAQRQLQQVTAQTQAATTAANRMGRAFAISVRRFAAFSIATRAVSLFTSTLSDAVKTAIDFERELVKISQVTGKTMIQLKGLTREITSLSTTLGVGSQSLLGVTRILSQAGFKADDLSVALRTLAKTELAPTFDNITQTAEGAIAIFNQFRQGAAALEQQLGAINAVAGQFAVEAGDLIDVVRRAGGVFKSAGGELNELIALFTSVRATTRESAESIGTGLRTIFTRIQRPKTIEFLKQFGIQLTDLEGKFVGPFEAVKRLSEGLAGLGEGDLTFIRIAEELGGFRQIGKVLPLIQQFTVAQEALNVANRAGSSLTDDAAKAQQSLAVRITKVKEEFLALIRSVTETTTFQIMANTALSLASALIKIGEAIKPLLPLLAAVAAVKFTKGIAGFAASFMGGMRSGRTYGTGGKVHHFARGGMVPGTGNRDTVPAMLQPGEFVIRKNSVNRLGADNLAAMNENRFALGGKARKFGIASLMPMDKPPQEEKATIPISNIRNNLARKSGGKNIVKKGNIANVDSTIRGILGLKGKQSVKTSAIAETMSNADVASKIEKRVELSIQKLIDNSASALGKSLSISVARKADNSVVKSVGSASTIGSIFEGALAMLGAPMDAGKKEQDPMDFPKGLGPNFASVFQSLVGIPVDAKKTASKKILKDTAKRKAAAYLANAVYSDPRWAMLSKTQSSNIVGKRWNEVKTGEFVDYKTLGYSTLREARSAMPEGFEARRKGSGSGFVRKFATGGNVGTDTVPALLTPGEFVVNRSSAQKIGYGNLNRMNKVGKYAKGGVVQHFAAGGVATSGAGDSMLTKSINSLTTTLLNLIGVYKTQSTSANSPTPASSATPKSSGGMGQKAKDYMQFGDAKNLQKQIADEAKSMAMLKKQTDALYKESKDLDAKIKAYDDSIDKINAQAKAGAKGHKALARLTQMRIEAEQKRSSIDKKALAAEKALTTATENRTKLIAQAKDLKQTRQGRLTEKFQGGTQTTFADSGMNKQANAAETAKKNAQAVQKSTDAHKKNQKSTDAMTMQNKLFAATMAVSMIQGFLPALDENSGALTRLSHSLLSMLTVVMSTITALEAFGLSLNKQALSDFFSGKGGSIARGANSLARKGTRAVGGMVSKIPGMGRVGSTITGFSKTIGGVAQGLTKLAGPVAAAAGTFFVVKQAGEALVEGFFQYEKKLKSAIESGNIEQARSVAESKANAQTGVNVAAGASAGAVLGALLGGPFGAALGAAAGGAIAYFLSDSASYAGQLAASQAALAKSQKSLAKASEEASKSLQEFQSGAISATDLLGATSGASADVARARKEAGRLATEGNKQIMAEADYGGLRGGLRNVFTLGGLIGESTGEKTARIEGESKKAREEVRKQEEELIKTAQPATDAVSRQVAASGGSFEDFLATIEKTDKNLYNAFMNQGTNDLRRRFENIAKEAARAKAALEAMNLGLRGPTATATAMSASMERFQAGLEVGGSTFSASANFLSAAMSSAAEAMDPKQIKAAMDDVAGNLEDMGVDPTKFRANTEAFVQAQQKYNSAFKKVVARVGEDQARGVAGAGSADYLKQAFAEELTVGLGDEAKKNLTAIIDGMELSNDEVNKIMGGDLSIFGDKLTEAGQKQFEQIVKIAEERQKAEQALIGYVRQRAEAERNLAEAQKQAVDLFMEGREIQGKYGGQAVTNQERRAAIVAKANTGANIAGIDRMRTGSVAELRRRQTQIVGNFGDIEGRRSQQGGMSGREGASADEMQRNLQQAQKDQVDTIRALIKLEEEELKIIQEKNKLEKDSLESLISGDIDKFFEGQAASGAQAAIAAGDMRTAEMFGAKAIGDAFKDIQRQQEAGVQSLFGRQLGGPGGLVEQAAGAALGSRGVSDPRMAQVLAGTTGAEEAAKSRLQELGGLLGEAGQAGAAMAEMQVQTASINVANATLELAGIEERGRNAAQGLSNGGVVYANRGMFVPRGTDTVPAMLTPGEFVVRRQAVNRGNNLQLLRAMNSSGGKSAAAMARGGKVGYYNNGGMVQYRQNGGEINNAGIGLDPQLITNLSNVFTNFVNGFNESIKNLKDTKLQVKMDSVNVNVNIVGGGMLEEISTKAKQKIIGEIIQKLKSEYGVGDNGKLTESVGNLPRPGQGQ